MPERLPQGMNTSANSGIGIRSERGKVLVAVMVSTALVAIDATILATAVPTIVDDIGGFAQFPWLFSVYLLAQAVSVPVYSKLADTFGRKPIMLIGIGLFLVGSVLCGFADSMLALILFRAVQGLGAGAVQPMSITIMGDIYSVAERARVQGYVAAVWAASSVIGPSLGGLFAQLDAWRWIFWINIPLCLLAAVLIWRDFHESVERRAHRIDVAGGILLTGALTLLILGVLEGGRAWAWTSPTSIGIFSAGAALLAVFAVVERRAAEPVLPGWVLRRRLLASTSLVSLGVGAVLIGLTTYVPTFLERAGGSPPLIAGLALAGLTLGWPVSASLSGRLLYLRYGFRPAVLIGAVVTIVGAALLWGTAATPSPALVAVSCFVIGLGMGLLASPSLIAAQASAPWSERAVVTGTNLFARSIGSAVGAAVMGAIANAIIGAGGEADPGRVADAGAAVFLATLVVSVLVLAAALAMPRVQADAAAASAGPPAGAPRPATD